MAQPPSGDEAQQITISVPGPVDNTKWEHFKADLQAFLEKHKKLKVKVTSIIYGPKP